MTNPNPQLAPAMALVELLRDHPDLPLASWDVQPSSVRLHGHIHGHGLDPLREYAELLGGEITPEYEVELPGQPTLQSHYLRTTWHDVRVVVVALAPVAVAVAA